MTATSAGQFALRRFDVGSFTVVDAGIASWRDGFQSSVRTTPFNERSPVRDGAVSFRLESTDPVFGQLWLSSGMEFFIRIRPQGPGPSRPEVVYSGPMEINASLPEGGVLVFDGRMAVNSASYSVQS